MQQGHIADRELLLDMDGELTAAESAEIRTHLEQCALCSNRKAQMEAISVFIRSQHNIAPPASETEFRTRLAQATVPRVPWKYGWAAALVLAAIVSIQFTKSEDVSGIRPLLTPGTAQSISLQALCSTERDNRPLIAPALAMEVFRRYGIQHPMPREYEVDYLIPPDLGGSDDPRNLWPQPYATGVWNSRVKDALEDRLHELVCSGALDLETAQQEIAGGWIVAYKKYFNTERPLPSHFAFVRDRAWE